VLLRLTSSFVCHFCLAVFDLITKGICFTGMLHVCLYFRHIFVCYFFSFYLLYGFFLYCD
jgi:hypothetical protein